MSQIDKIKTFLPYGEELRALLVHSELSEFALKTMLNEKGIFLDLYEKNNTVPALMTMILSPLEYEMLLEKQSLKEDKVKYRTLKLPWNSDENLINSIPENLQLNELIEASTAYKPNIHVVGSPQFKMVDKNPNKLELSFDIERNNFARGWDERKTFHRGSLTIEKRDSGTLELVLKKTHTAKETNQVGELVLKHLKNHFKEKKMVEKEVDFERIQFNHFSNANRVQFFWGFTNDLDRLLKFERITQLSVYPDSEQDPPKELQEFLMGIKNLKINGSALQEHVLISNKHYHEKIIFGSITIRYRFEMAEAYGYCDVEFAFPDYEDRQRKDSEFQFNIQRILLDRPYRNFASKPKIQFTINRKIEEEKLGLYTLHKTI